MARTDFNAKIDVLNGLFEAWKASKSTIYGFFDLF